MRLKTRTTVAALAVLAAAAPATVVIAPASAGPGTSDRSSAHKPKDPNATPFALRAWGYSTRATGGDVPTDSGGTAWEVIGCTNRAGLHHTNNIAGVTLPGLGTISAAKTRVWTTRKGGVVSSWARNTIGKVVLSDSPLGTLTLNAVSSTARAYHDGSKFKTSTNTDLARLTFAGPVGPAQDFPIPAPGRPVTIPGFAKVTVAASNTPTTKNGARAYSNGLKVELFATHSTVRVAHAVAQILSGVQTGLFSGQSAAVTGNAASGVVGLGRNTLLKMPCQGTDGVVKTRSASSTDLGGQVAVGVAKSEEMAKQNGKKAWGYTRSRVASFSLGDQLRIEGIVGQVNVSRTGSHLRKLNRSTKGTTIGTIVVNGEPRKFPDTGVLEIPGVAKLQRSVTEKSKNGLSVIALRIKLLDGTGAVIDLGNARMQVRRSAH
ncbi:choice-of-anchor P family protein [Nocardioides conyzicola]